MSRKNKKTDKKNIKSDALEISAREEDIFTHDFKEITDVVLKGEDRWEQLKQLDKRFPWAFEVYVPDKNCPADKYQKFTIRAYINNNANPYDLNTRSNYIYFRQTYPWLQAEHNWIGLDAQDLPNHDMINYLKKIDDESWLSFIEDCYSFAEGQVLIYDEADYYEEYIQLENDFIKSDLLDDIHAHIMPHVVNSYYMFLCYLLSPDDVREFLNAKLYDINYSDEEGFSLNQDINKIDAIEIINWIVNRLDTPKNRHKWKMAKLKFYLRFNDNAGTVAKLFYDAVYSVAYKNKRLLDKFIMLKNKDFYRLFLSVYAESFIDNPNACWYVAKCSKGYLSGETKLQVIAGKHDYGKSIKTYLYYKEVWNSYMQSLYWLKQTGVLQDALEHLNLYASPRGTLKFNF